MAFEKQAQTNISDGVEFSDEGGEYQQQQLNIKEIVLRHLRKIGDLCCKEFTGGYWVKKPVNTAGGILFLETYHEDVREAYCNAVDFIIDILYPLADEKFRTYIKSNEDVETNSKLEIKEKLIRKRITFKEINIMFERINFWGSSGTSEESQ